MQKLLKNGEVKLVDGLKYSVFLELSSTLQNQIIDELLNFQDKWTKEDAREISYFCRIESLEHSNCKPLVYPAIVKCTKFASYYPPNQLISILYKMAELQLGDELFCKTVAERAVREKFSYSLLKAVSVSFGMIGFIDKDYLEFFSHQLLRNRIIHDFVCFAKLNYKPGNFDVLMKTHD